MRVPLLLALVVASPAVAQPGGETLQMMIPPNYRVAHEHRDNEASVVEWVPAGQSREEWQERLVRLVMRAHASVTPNGVRDSTTRMRLGPCTVGPIRDGRDNGYLYALWAESCAAAAGRSEETWVKASRGQNTLYIVRKSFAHNPHDSDVTKWVAYLGRVQLCDQRLPDRPCRR